MGTWLNSGDSWLVLASLGVSVVALAAWIKDAGDDWLAPDPTLDQTGDAGRRRQVQG